MTESADKLHPFGAGSHAPLADEREMPACYPIKGNADSMLYHRPDSRNYGATIAEVWFVSPSAAEAAGFTLSSTHPKDSSSADFEPGTDGHPCTADEVAGLSFGSVGGAVAAAGAGAGVMGVAAAISGDGDGPDGDGPDGDGPDGEGPDGDVRATIDATAPGGDVRATIDGSVGDAADAAGSAADDVAASARETVVMPLAGATGDDAGDAARETVQMPAAGAAAAVAGAGAAAAVSGSDSDDAGDAGSDGAGGSGDGGSGDGGSGDSGSGSGGSGAGGWDGMSDDERMPFGPGSHAPDPDDVHLMPACHPIKGNADSMKYHRPDSHSYAVTTAEVWFVSPSAAEAAGFALAGAHPKGSSSADFEPGTDGHPCSASEVEGLGLGALLLGAGAGAGVAAAASAGSGDGASDADDVDTTTEIAAAADLDATTEMAALDGEADEDTTTELSAGAAAVAGGAAVDAAAAWDGMSDADLHPFGPGSHVPNPADVYLMPACHPIKGNADSMKYHRPDSQGYEPTKAEVWFVSPSVAEAAGFALAGSHPEGSSSADFEPGGSGHPCAAADLEGMGLGGLLLGGAALAGVGAVGASLLDGADDADVDVAAIDGDIDATVEGDIDASVGSADADLADASLAGVDDDITVDDDREGGGLGVAAAAAAGAAALGGAALLGRDGDADVDLPDVDLPDVDLPDVDLPDVDLPDADLTVGDVDLPGADLTVGDVDLADGDVTVSADDDGRGLGLGAAAAGAAVVGGGAAAAAGIAGRRTGKAAADGAVAAASDVGAKGRAAASGGGGRGRDDDDRDRAGGFGWGWLKLLLPLLLLLLLLGLLLAFCGGDEDDVADPVVAVDPTATAVPPTATAVPEPTATAVPEPTATAVPEPTPTPAPEPTATPAPEPTATPEPPSCAALVPALEDNGFTTLLAAIGVAGAGESLTTSGPLTVFAPTDEAFTAVPSDITAALLADADLLTQVLRYHATQGAVFSGDLAPGAVPTFNGSNLAIRTDLDGPRVNTSGITIADVEADACVVHGVDSVLIPPALLSTLGVPTLNAAVAGGPITFVDGTADFTDADSNTLAAICALVSAESDLAGLPAVQWQRSGHAAIDEARAAAIADALAACGAAGLSIDALAPKPAFTG